jgi:hypothetical protein
MPVVLYDIPAWYSDILDIRFYRITEKSRLPDTDGRNPAAIHSETLAPKIVVTLSVPVRFVMGVECLQTAFIKMFLGVSGSFLLGSLCELKAFVYFAISPINSGLN